MDTAAMSLESLSLSLYVMVLAIFVGFEVIAKVPTLLHTPLMSGSNAISGIILIGAILVLANANTQTVRWLAFSGIFFASVNVFGGFVVTERMLRFFRQKKETHK